MAKLPNTQKVRLTLTGAKAVGNQIKKISKEVIKLQSILNKLTVNIK